MLNNSGFSVQSKGLHVKFSKEKGDLFSFQCKLLQNFQDTSMDTIMYLKDSQDSSKMVNLLIDHIRITEAYVKTAIEEQHKLCDSYNHLNNHGTCYTLLDSLDAKFKMYVDAHLLMTSVSCSSGCRSSKPCKATCLNVSKQ